MTKYIPVYPSCLQTILASVLSQSSSHTVPHKLLKQISTLPLVLVVPSTSRISPSLHGAEYEKTKML